MTKFVEASTQIKILKFVWICHWKIPNKIDNIKIHNIVTHQTNSHIGYDIWPCENFAFHYQFILRFICIVYPSSGANSLIAEFGASWSVPLFE